MVKTVIGAAIIYYLGLEWWWWGLFVGAFFIDVYQEHVNNMNDVIKSLTKQINLCYNTLWKKEMQEH